MKRNCSTCICKEGSCYPSTTIFDKDKTCKSYDPDYEGYIADLEKENAELKEINTHTLSQLNLDNGELIIENEKLKKENAELKSENQKWKDEWQEQVQKATDEGYARTLQTIQLSKAKEVLRNLLSAYITYADSFDDRDNEIVEEAVQFLNSEVEK